METDMQFYTRFMVRALDAARRASTPEERIRQERLAKAFELQILRLENMPATTTPDPMRLKAAA